MLKLLRKLGILRFGTKSYKYTSGKDMPARALMDDVYDEEQDLVNKQDIQNVKESLKTSKGKKTLKWVIFGIVGCIGFIFTLGFIAGLLESPDNDVDLSAQQQSSANVNMVTTTAAANSSGRVSPLDEIRQVFEGVSRANSEENIDLFMQYYADSFPGRAAKRQNTLDTWDKYDFVSLDFFVFDLKEDGNMAHASVGWEIALLENGSANPRLIETTNEVDLVKRGEKWQIVSLQ